MSYKKRNARRGDSPRNLSDLVVKLYPGKETASELQAFGWWSRGVPVRIRNNSAPISIRRRTLLVHVTTSAWAQELQFMKDDLLERLHRACPSSPVKNLVFRVGPLTKQKEVEPPKAPPSVRPAPLTEEVARELVRVKDDGLRDAVAAAAALSLAREESTG
jgi:hypothetical protein